MSNRKLAMAATKKANQKARTAPPHALRSEVREAERKERAARWAAKHKGGK